MAARPCSKVGEGGVSTMVWRRRRGGGKEVEPRWCGGRALTIVGAGWQSSSSSLPEPCLHFDSPFRHPRQPFSRSSSQSPPRRRRRPLQAPANDQDELYNTRTGPEATMEAALNSLDDTTKVLPPAHHLLPSLLPALIDTLLCCFVERARCFRRVGTGQSTADEHYPLHDRSVSFSLTHL